MSLEDSCRGSRNIGYHHGPFPTDLVCEQAQDKSTWDGTKRGTGRDDFRLHGRQRFAAEVIAHKGQRRADDARIVAEEEAGNSGLQNSPT